MAYSNRLILTHRCNAKCPHCFNLNDRHLLSEDDDMDYDKLERYVEHNECYLQNSPIKLMGGEPTIHPRFSDIVNMLILRLGYINVFTNGLKSSIKILLSDPLVTNSILDGACRLTFNSMTFNDKVWLEEINNSLQDFRHTFTLHNVINERNYKFVLNKMKRIVDNYPPQIYRITLSCDVSINIFNKIDRENYRKVWLGFLKDARKVVGPNVVFNWDHAFPYCFFDNETIEIVKSINPVPVRNFCSCFIHSSGLIDPDFSIWFCNQFRHKVGNVYENGDAPLSYGEIDRKLKEARVEKNKILLENVEDCKDCSMIDFCRGGCYCNHLLK